MRYGLGTGVGIGELPTSVSLKQTGELANARQAINARTNHVRHEEAPAAFMRAVSDSSRTMDQQAREPCPECP
jgi:hypothetical protein